MNLTLPIPDDLANGLSAEGADLSRRALEAFALEEYKSGHLTEDELRRILGFGTRYQLDGFLKGHDVCSIQLCVQTNGSTMSGDCKRISRLGSAK